MQILSCSRPVEETQASTTITEANLHLDAGGWKQVVPAVPHHKIRKQLHAFALKAVGRDYGK